jgi:Glycosyl transferase family 2
MELAISTMTKNQGSRLEEWIRYHNKLGFNKFIIFLDNCNDNSEEVLKSIEDIEIIIYKTENFDRSINRLYWIKKSHKMYDYVLENFVNLDWIGFIEVDEFIFPQIDNFDLIGFLNNLKTTCLYINSWDFKGPFNENKKIIGQSNLIWTDEQRYKSEYKNRGKSIIKPKHFSKCMDAHHFMSKDYGITNEFKVEHVNYIQTIYGEHLTMDDNLLRIYHFRNHTPSHMKQYKQITIDA